ncbi:MAG: polyphosphate polymerase domain-containing protein [Hyphomicrobium sp.]
MSDRTFTNRYEIKYLLEARELPAIEQALSGFLKPDVNGVHSGGYYNHSIYFDSPDYRYYCEKREGDLMRMKPRIRVYRTERQDSPRTIYLELKGRYDRIVTKRRATIDRTLAERFLAKSPLDLKGHTSGNSVLDEFIYLMHRFNLGPCVSVLYHRSAFFGAFYPGVRVTFDRMIECSRRTGLDAPEEAFIGAVPANRLVIELKYNDKVPRMLLQRFNSLGLQQATFSKFATSLERTHDAVFDPFYVH